jgi:membrane protein
MFHNPISGFLRRHPTLAAFIEKVMKDNLGLLASVVAWTLLTSIVPLMVGILAISGFLLRDPATRLDVVNHLSAALQGVLDRKDIDDLTRATVQHHGLFGVIGLLGVLWGASNVGGAISTVFQPVFQVKGRSFVREKLIDIGMFFVFAALLLLVVLSTTATAMLGRVASLATPRFGTLIAGTVVSLLAALVLFSLVYLVFPNTEPSFKLHHVLPGAAIAAVLFQVLTFAFPIYASVSHFQRYAGLIFSLLLLTGWIYFFAVILLIGAEFVAFGALREARGERKLVGPAPDGTVPQRADAASSPAPQRPAWEPGQPALRPKGKRRSRPR